MTYIGGIDGGIGNRGLLGGDGGDEEMVAKMAAVATRGWRRPMIVRLMTVRHDHAHRRHHRHRRRRFSLLLGSAATTCALQAARATGVSVGVLARCERRRAEQEKERARRRHRDSRRKGTIGGLVCPQQIRPPRRPTSLTPRVLTQLVPSRARPTRPGPRPHSV